MHQFLFPFDWKSISISLVYYRYLIAEKFIQMISVSFRVLGWGTKKPRDLFLCVAVPEKLTFLKSIFCVKVLELSN